MDECHVGVAWWSQHPGGRRSGSRLLHRSSGCFFLGKRHGLAGSSAGPTEPTASVIFQVGGDFRVTRLALNSRPPPRSTIPADLREASGTEGLGNSFYALPRPSRESDRRRWRDAVASVSLSSKLTFIARLEPRSERDPSLGRLPSDGIADRPSLQLLAASSPQFPPTLRDTQGRRRIWRDR